jgi:hypothetical protein
VLRHCRVPRVRPTKIDLVGAIAVLTTLWLQADSPWPQPS